MNDTHDAYSAGEVEQSPSPIAQTLYITDLSEMSVQRSNRWHKGGITDWSLAEWTIAAIGELGETLNVIKKLNRERDGMVGNTTTAAALQAQLGDEIADTVCYLVLVAARAGVDISWVGHFAKLRDIGEELVALFPEMSLSDVGLRVAMELGAISGDVATRRIIAKHFADSIAAALGKLAHMAVLAGIDLAEAVVSKFNRVSEKNGFPERLALR